MEPPQRMAIVKSGTQWFLRCCTWSYAEIISNWRGCADSCSHDTRRRRCKAFSRCTHQRSMARHGRLRRCGYHAKWTGSRTGNRYQKRCQGKSWHNATGHVRCQRHSDALTRGHSQGAAARYIHQRRVERLSEDAGQLERSACAERMASSGADWRDDGCHPRKCRQCAGSRC